MCMHIGVSSGFASVFLPLPVGEGRGEGIRPHLISTNPTIRQRHLFRRLNHQRTQLGYAVVGHARYRP
ncbi:isocitrate dehydrogenase [Enterobacter huaxiensis]|nr:isocitrate dehydrogenase [Enterobacter huaxiensis]